MSSSDFKTAIYNAVDNLDTVALDDLLADAPDNLWYRNSEVRASMTLLVSPTADKYDHHADKLLYCLRALLADPRFPSLGATNDGFAAIPIIGEFLCSDQPRMDILQTWLQGDFLGSRIANQIPQFFGRDDLYTTNCTIMRESWFHDVFNVNGSTSEGVVHVHQAVLSQSPRYLRVLFKAPNLRADRLDRNAMTPLNLAHHKCTDLLELYESRARSTDDDQLTDDEWTDDGEWETDDGIRGNGLPVPAHTFKFANTLYEYTENGDSYYDKFDLKEEKDKLVEIVRLLLGRHDVDMHKVDVRRHV